MQGARGNLSGAAWIIHAALFLLLGQAASAADHRVETVAGTLIVPVDSNWVELKELPQGLEDAVGFRIGDGSLMQWLFVPGNQAPAGSGASGNLRILTMQLRRMLEEQNAEMGDDLLTLSGGSVKGYYVRATDPNPKSGEWKYTYAGWIAVGEFPVMFNIVWNQGGQAAADRALAAVKNLRLAR